MNSLIYSSLCGYDCQFSMHAPHLYEGLGLAHCNNHQGSHKNGRHNHNILETIFALGVSGTRKNKEILQNQCLGQCMQCAL